MEPATTAAAATAAGILITRHCSRATLHDHRAADTGRHAAGVVQVEPCGSDTAESAPATGEQVETNGRQSLNEEQRRPHPVRITERGDGQLVVIFEAHVADATARADVKSGHALFGRLVIANHPGNIARLHSAKPAHVGAHSRHGRGVQAPIDTAPAASGQLHAPC